VAHHPPTREGTDHRDGGRALRATVPAESFGAWAPAAGRDPVAAVLADDVTGYLGDGADLAPELVRFAKRYADQVEADHAAFVDAVPDAAAPTS
jgi:Uncharacterized protein conserved in bacteria (DUF2252)